MDTWSGQIATTAERFADVVRHYLDQVVDVLPDGLHSLFRITSASATRLQVDRFTFPGWAGAWDPEAQSWVEAVREEAQWYVSFPGCLIVEMLAVGGASDRLLVTVTCHDALAADLCAGLIAEIGRVWPEARPPSSAQFVHPEVLERREKIRKLFAEGKKNLEIANVLDISESTVRRDLSAMQLWRRKKRKTLNQ